MRTRKILILSAGLAAVVLGATPLAAQGTFRDDGSVVVNRSVLDALEPRLQRPKSGPSVKISPSGKTRKAEAPKARTDKAQTDKASTSPPAKVAEPAKGPVTPAAPVRVAEPQPVKTEAPKPPAASVTIAEPATPQPAKPAEPPSVKAEAPKPPAQPVKITEPAKPQPAQPAAKPDETPPTRLVGPLTEPGDEQKLAAPILPQADISRALPSASRPSVPVPSVTAAPLPAPAPEPPPAKVAAVTPPAAGRGLVTPQPPAVQAPTVQPPTGAPAGQTEAVASRAGRGAAVEQRDGNLRLLFAANEATLPQDAQKALEAIARRLEAEHNLYIQLLAYAEGTEDEASKARRLSLSRALAVRSYLMNDGVRSTRIEVRALGHKVPDGPADRVDVVIDKRY